MNNDKPTWLQEPCPPWCTGDHSGQDFVVDRHHESPLMTIPVIQQITVWPAVDAEPRHLLDAGELVLVLTRPVGGDETFVVIADERTRLQVTVESARRLHRAMENLWARYGDPVGE